MYKRQPIGLVKKEFDIVELLSQNAGQVFDKERIYERVWGYYSEGDSSVVAEHTVSYTHLDVYKRQRCVLYGYYAECRRPFAEPYGKDDAC